MSATVSLKGLSDYTSIKQRIEQVTASKPKAATAINNTHSTIRLARFISSSTKEAGCVVLMPVGDCLKLM